MDKFMRVTHVLPTTDKILSTGWRREGMIACGADKKNIADVFLVDFTKVGALNPEDERRRTTLRKSPPEQTR